jgi:hypothetical protein
MLGFSPVMMFTSSLQRNIMGIQKKSMLTGNVGLLRRIWSGKSGAYI